VTNAAQKIESALGALREALAEVQPPTPLAVESAPEGMVNTAKLAVKLGVHPRTIANWRTAGCPCLRISSRGYRYDLAAVRQWLAARGGAS